MYAKLVEKLWFTILTKPRQREVRRKLSLDMDVQRPPELSAAFTLRSVGSNDAHGADPVGRDLRHQWVQDLQTGGVHHKDFWVMSITKQPPLPLSANSELVELQKRMK